MLLGAASTTIYKIDEEGNPGVGYRYGEGNLQSFESDFNPFAMRTELSFNLPNAILGKLTATSKSG